MNITYLACPYTHEDPKVMQARYDFSNVVMARMLKTHGAVISPLGLHHPLAVRFQMPRGWDFWMQIDLRLIEACTDLLLIKLKGWDKSRGVAAELRYAAQTGKIIHSYHPEQHDLPDILK